MLKFTPGTPDEMQILIACGIATYLIVFPIVILVSAICAEVWYQSQPAGADAARPLAPATGHPREVAGAVAPPRHAEVATAV